MVIVTEPILLLRALKSSELACLLALTLADRPVRVSWLGRVTGLSPHTLTGALNTLQALGLAQDDGQRSGWHIAASLQEQLLARAETLPVAGECPDSSPPGAGRKDACQRQLSASTPSALPKNEMPQHDPIPMTAPQTEQDSPTHDTPAVPFSAGRLAGQEGANRDTAGSDASGAIYQGAIRDSLLEEENQELLLSTPDLESIPAGGKLPLPDHTDAAARVGQVLQATAALFGEPVHGPPSRYPDLRRLLAVIAHVHRRRQRLRKPARVVYVMLRDGIPPPEEILADPLAYLPVDFLHAAGLPLPPEAGRAESGGWEDDMGWEEETDWEEEQQFAYSQEYQPAESCPTLSLPVQPEAKQGASCPTAAQAWHFAVEALRGEMPLSAYEKFLRPARLLRFKPGEPSPGGCRFTVQAADEYSQEWLRQRVSLSLERTLCGICQEPVRVEFVVTDSP